MTKYIEPALYDELVAKLERRRVETAKLLRLMKAAPTLAEKRAIKAEIKSLSNDIYKIVEG